MRAARHRTPDPIHREGSLNASGGCGGGGTGGGGGESAPASASCAQITGFSNTTSYNWGILSRIDTPYSVSSSCPTWVTADVTYTNQLTGNVDFEHSAVILPGTADRQLRVRPRAVLDPVHGDALGAGLELQHARLAQRVDHDQEAPAGIAVATRRAGRGG
ncbi:MAG TPA: hypothetical protein VJ741_14600, partial [Solirubrobacteraceae bacterium]|nr:hypothetical protein [Solirubrobacteraceae bacterium]